MLENGRSLKEDRDRMRKGARGKAPHAPNESQLQPKRR